MNFWYCNHAVAKVTMIVHNCPAVGNAEVSFSVRYRSVTDCYRCRRRRLLPHAVGFPLFIAGAAVLILWFWNVVVGGTIATSRSFRHRAVAIGFAARCHFYGNARWV